MSKVAVFYGSNTTEHEVSIITAMQVMNALVGAGHEVIPCYITKSGKWLAGDSGFLKPETYQNLVLLEKKHPHYILSADEKGPILINPSGLSPLKKTIRFDIGFPVIHGLNGEDGTLQGYLKLLNIPFVGCGVTASAVGIDKYLAKIIAQKVGLTVVPDLLVSQADWSDQKQSILKKALTLGKVVYVKPVKLGSSIGVKRVVNAKELEEALDVAFVYDSRVLLERGVSHMKEINISILGNNPYQVSVTEQPVASSATLSYEDKYLSERGKSPKSAGMASADRLMPAPVDQKVITKIETQAKAFFAAIDGRGIARIDFMYVPESDTIYFNEINTIPGSLSFYLWEKTGLPFHKQVDKLVTLGFEAHRLDSSKITQFSTNILANFAAKGLKR